MELGEAPGCCNPERSEGRLMGGAQRRAAATPCTKWCMSDQLEVHMSKFRFALSNAALRQEGMVESDSFVQAVDSLWQHVEVHRGDVLEIGVRGFPPARYEC